MCPDRSPITRRIWLRASGAAVLGGLTLPQVLRLREVSARGATGADEPAGHPGSVIFVTLGGGPSQFETFDPKPDAISEYRGEFRPIPTRLAGVQFCELFPRLAELANRIAVVRSVHHEQASHIAEHIVETGYDLRNPGNARSGEMPSVGAVVSRVRGVGASGIPGYVSLPRHHAYAGAHWLGAQHHHFAINDDPNSPDFQVGNLALHRSLSGERLRDRQQLLAALDHEVSLRDLDGQAVAVGDFARQAFDLITGERARQAFDVSRERPEVRDRYGRTSVGQRLLLARRLVEAEVPFVTVRMGDWDDHQQLATRIRQRAPQLDAGLSALIEDLRERGLDRQVLIVAMGEFGRTPRINTTAGRDHFPAVNSVLFAGGLYQMGQVIGATDRNGAVVTAAPYRPTNVLSMVYRHLGIDPGLTFPDYAGRPRYVLEDREPIVEL